MTIALSVLALVFVLDVTQAAVRRLRPPPTPNSQLPRREDVEAVRRELDKPTPLATAFQVGPGLVRFEGDRQGRVTELYAEILAGCELTVGQGRAIKRILEDYTDILIPEAPE